MTFFGSANAVDGQELIAGAAPTIDQTLSIEQIERTLAELEQSPSTDVETRLQSAENYKSAINNLKSAIEHENLQKVLIGETESVVSRAEKLKQQRAEFKDKKSAIDPNLSLQDLEQLLPQWELQLSSYKKARAAAESESQTRSQRRKDIRAEMVTIGERIADAKSQLQALNTAPPTIQAASLASRLSTRRLTLANKLSALEAELAKYDAEEAADLVRLKIDASTGAVGFTEKEISLLQKQINVARQDAAEHSFRMARVDAIAAAPSLAKFADHNQSLAEKAKAIAESLTTAQNDLKTSEDVLEELQRQFEQARKKVELVGLTSSVGAMLRKQKLNLPDVSQRRNAVSQRHGLINDTQYESFEFEDERRALDRPEDLVREIVADADRGEPLNNALLESAATDLIERQVEHLATLISSTSKYFDTLIELDTVDQQIIALAAEYETYIDERVLWIRSGRSLTTDFSLNASDQWLISPTQWINVAMVILRDLRRWAPLYLLVVIAAVVLRLRGRPMRQRIERIGTAACKANCRSLVPTLQVIALTWLVALGWPAVMAFVGWRLKESVGESEFVHAVGNGLLGASILWLTIEWMRQVCRPSGLGDAHFRWNTHFMETSRRTLNRYWMFAIPLAFVTATLSTSDTTPGRDSLERLVFVAGMVITSFLVFGWMMPGGLLRDYYVSHLGSWTERFKFLWAFAISCIPLSLACLAAMGYYYTAQVLFWRMFETCLFIVALYVTREICLRMLLLRRRQLSIEQSRLRAAAGTKPNGDIKPTMVAGIITEDPQADISTQSLQSRRLISTGLLAVSLVGLWLIWVQVLPALSMLDHYPVWSKSAGQSVAQSGTTIPNPVANAATNSGGQSDDDSSSRSIAKSQDSQVTLSDLAFAILIVVVTVVLSRNGPGLLEMSVLQQLPVDASVRYAITTLVSYAIVLIGTIAACSTIGLEWSQIQWLATALTFGLAFGLQEMFANFVAGLIILLERPIRVGDIVTVDDVTGVVSRIRIRATSITNWDRKEYVVPNKEFITGRLLNWTLSDKINRIVVEVGIAYGSDTERARELLLQVANEHPLILKDPPSVAAFEGFGDSSLNLVLRTYLPTMDNRLEVIHQLHTNINLAFRAEGIEIAFPQRDLHVRTTAGLLGRSSDDRATPIKDLAAEERVSDTDRGDQRREAA